MYSTTKEYIKREILKLIEKTNDTEHKGGSVTIFDVQSVVDEIKIVYLERAWEKED
jgi:hypothetical protein